MPNQVVVGPQAANDSSSINQRGDNYGSTVVQDYNGRYAELVRRGQVYVASTAAAGIAILVSATTGNVPTLWNPSGSGRIVYPIMLNANWLSGAVTASNLLWSVTTGTGANIGTGNPVVSFTNVAPVNALVGGPADAVIKWAPATSTYTAAPAFYAATGINLKATALDSQLSVDMQGLMALMPGNALSLTCSVASSVALIQASIWYVSVPAPVGM